MRTTLSFTEPTTANGVCEQSFTLDGVPAVLWAPDADPTGRPVVLLAHGGGQHKRHPGVVARAHRFVTALGATAVALDAPGHGERPRTADDERAVAALRERMASGEPAGDVVAATNAGLAARAVPEWRALLDALAPTGPVGVWGASLGGAIGLSLAAADPRISAAVVGLIGGGPLGEVAARVTVPVELFLQWDDEFVPRADGLALFDALAAPEKTLHANPGGHGELPRFEVESARLFFARNLT
jgi:pimeloyl-ACP methyl ester carboxylesterase